MTKNVLTLVRLGALVGFLSLCGVYLSAQQPAKPQVKTAAMDDCTGCLNGGDGSCLACHNFTYAAGGCQTCYGTNGLPGSGKADKQKYIWVPGVTTGKKMEVVEGWQGIGLPVHHREIAVEARKKTADCKGRKTISE